MFSLKAHLAILIALCYLYFAAWLVPAARKFWSWQKKYRSRRLRRKMIAELRQFGPLWVANSSKTVAAVCTYTAFKHALDEWNKKISKGPGVFWGTPILHIEQTLTFTTEDMPVCTGSKQDVETIFIDLIYDLLGRKYDKSLIHKEGSNLEKIIVKRDNRLFIPFVGSKWNPEWEPYRHTDVDLARLRLHRCVLDAIPH
jgi:hypothetical protein